MKKISADAAEPIQTNAPQELVQQAELFFDCPYSALRSTVEALGGAKRVGLDLWPARTAEDAARRLLHCLDPERPERLDLYELFAIWRMGRVRGIHCLAEYVGQDMSYDIRPISKQERKAQLGEQLQALVSATAALARQFKDLE